MGWNAPLNVMRTNYLNGMGQISADFVSEDGITYMPYPYPLQREGEGQAGSGTPLRSPAPASKISKSNALVICSAPEAMMDSKANERTLYRAQAVVRAYARALEAEEQGRLYENIADDFAVTAKMILGDSTSKDFYELADAVDKIHSEVWFKNQQREVRSQG